MIDVFDEFLNEGASDKGSRFDPFLQKILAEKRGEENISNIIRSIQKNQNDIIDFDFDKSFIVQGCAGSGKTMILLHRLANLKYNRPDLKWNQVKIITPNSLFNTYIDALSENLGIKAVAMRSFGLHPEKPCFMVAMIVLYCSAVIAMVFLFMGCLLIGENGA